ncbi:MAG TPA: hypothetical protein VM639_23695 [Dongiaceae bacterium]|nr:hypothetical protein [Dongiaceae bacterium]
MSNPNQSAIPDLNDHLGFEEDYAYELRWESGGNVTLHQRSDLALDARHDRDMGHMRRTEGPYPFVEVSKINTAQWKPISNWFSWELNHAGITDDVILWDAIPLPLQFGRRLHRLMEIAHSIWNSRETDNDQPKVERLKVACKNWRSNASMQQAGSSFYGVADFIQNSETGQKSYCTEFLDGTLVIHLPHGIIEGLADFISPYGYRYGIPKRKGITASKWLAPQWRDQAAILLIDQRAHPTPQVLGGLGWGLGPIFTSGPICLGHPTDRTMVQQMDAIRSLWLSFKEALDKGQLEVSGHRLLELHGALDLIEEEYAKLSSVSVTPAPIPAR